MNTEEKILFAAEQEFLNEGFSGARMQSIADKAGINKALVHYYYKSKSLLFEQVFKKKMSLMLPNMNDTYFEQTSFLSVIENFIERQIELLIKNPFIPLFIISTLSNLKNQDFIKLMPFEKLMAMKKSFQNDLEKNLINKEINFEQFLLSLLGMCAYPFIGKIIVKKAFNKSDLEFIEMMNDRKKELKIYVKQILKPEQ